MERTRRPYPAGGGLLALLVTLFLGTTVSLDAADERPPSPPVAVDRERGEIRIPAWFVNPTYKLEVFACHESGPTHETVLAFRSEGEEIYTSLKEAGFRGPEYWNATSPLDTRLTGGDRAVVWLRWEWKGKVQEVPAEDVLIEEATGLPLFVRGFSFTGQPVDLGDPPRKGIPKGVELTIGGMNRQSAIFSMLEHTNDLPEILPWTPSPEVDPRKFPDFKEMVGGTLPCTMIVRRVKSETALIDMARERETDPRRRAVREAQRPIAEKIDAKKGEFEKKIAEIRSLLERGERPGADEAERKAVAERLAGILAKGGLLATEIQELYLDLIGKEERYRFEVLSQKQDLNADHRGWIEMAFRSGFRFDQAIATKNREAAAMAADDKVPAEKAALLRRALGKTIEALQEERMRRWEGFRLNHEYRPKIKSTDPQEDGYVLRLFQESEMRAQAEMRALRGKIEAARAEADGLRAQAEGLPPAGIEARKKTAEAMGRLAAAEIESVELLEKIRWSESDGPGEEKGPDERARLEAERLKVLEKIKALRTELEAASGRPAGTGEEPPTDGSGKPLFPDDIAGGD